MTNIPINRLKEHRERAGIPQDELAKAARITPTTISLIENRHVAPMARTCRRIMDGFKALEREQPLWDVFPAMKGKI